MHAFFYKKDCLLILVLKPKQAKATAPLLQMAWLEQKNDGKSVPAYADNFFEELAATTEDAYLKFAFPYLELAIAFITKIVQAQKHYHIDSSTLEKLLEGLEPYRTGGFAVN